ncbi:MAG: RNA polymerase sigma-70 factor [Bacteroidota bacterium]
MHSINGIDEPVLIERLSKGDTTAFELIFRHYYPGLVIYTSNFTRDHDQAEEIVQDFFSRLWEKHMNITSAQSLKSYCFQSVKNRALNFLRDKKVKSDYVNEIEQLSRENLLFNEDLYVTSELQDRIELAIGGLPDKCKEVFVLSRFKGFSNEEIAVNLNISKRTVETHISKAIKVLKAELKDYLGLLLLLNLL